MTLETIRLKIADILNYKYISDEGFFFDNWSFVHLFTGFAIGKYLRFIKPGMFFVLLVLYELFEIWASTNMNGLFLREPFIDMFWDFVLTYAAYTVGRLL